MAKGVIADIHSLSPETEIVEELVDFTNPWDFEEVYGKLLDLVEHSSFDPEDEDYLFHITTGTHVAQICIFLLTESRRFPGRLLQSNPAGAVGKSAQGSISIVDLDLSRYDQIASRFKKHARDDVAFLKSGIETLNPGFNRLMEQIEKVAIRSGEPILLTGPTGAGKSRLARQIFELQKQRALLKGDFVELNCATLRGDGAMSTLFGHVRGAYTGAVGDRKGLLRQANEGMIFLDEVGELGLDEQAMLLHAIETKRFLAVGADTETHSDFRIICGTNRDLFASVQTGRFREDLLARINLWTFCLPGLRERPEDIQPNIQFELDLWEMASGTRVTFNKEAYERYISFSGSAQAIWSANFRDLKASVMRMATLASCARITIDDVQAEISRLAQSWHGHQHIEPEREALEGLEVDNLDEFDQCQLNHVIRVCRKHGSLAGAGRQLFAISRQQRSSFNDSDRLRKYLARFGLDWEMVINGPIYDNKLSNSVN